MIVGCYVLDLYCDIDYAHLMDGRVNYEFAGGKAEFTGDSLSATKKQARASGWQFGRNYVICPSCAKHSNKERRATLHAAVAAGWTRETKDKR